MSSPARTAGAGSLKWNIPPSPNHRIGRPPCRRDVSPTSVPRFEARLCRYLVTLLLREPRVPGQVDEADRRGPLHLLEQPLTLHRDLGMVYRMLDPDVLAMAGVDVDDGSLDEPDHLISESSSELEQLPLILPGSSEPLFDLHLVELSLGLRDPTEAVRVDAEQSECRSLLGANANERRDQLDQFAVALASPVGGRRRREADRFVDRLDQPVRHVQLSAEIEEGGLQALRAGHDWRVQPCDREFTLP